MFEEAICYTEQTKDVVIEIERPLPQCWFHSLPLLCPSSYLSDGTRTSPLTGKSFINYRDRKFTSFIAWSIGAMAMNIRVIIPILSGKKTLQASPAEGSENTKSQQVVSIRPPKARHIIEALPELYTPGALEERWNFLDVVKWSFMSDTFALQENYNAVKAAGYPTLTAELPSLDPGDPTVGNCGTDAALIRQHLDFLVEDEGRDVVLVMHSYASMPGGAAASGLSKSQRSQDGQKGGVLGLPSTNLNVPDQPEKIFAADTSEEKALVIGNAIKPHASLAFFSPQPSPAWTEPAFIGRLAYLVTSEDLAVSKVAQYGMISGTGQEWHVREIISGHCGPFIDKVGETVEILKEFIQLFEKDMTGIDQPPT
ncbi:hypothetical protein ETB97_007403 [Aspergillus alliaceus]|uniref:AB hydrolase-1 domain-containing protein n=1 Tax=Petromyces alliaceus TaxID=209559 RepID=A0A8H6EBA5_PETAA|nr:hypothetical protein ETB97_007403 [Aspergillus burnettii]